MKILAHRGFWMNESEKNSREAIKRAFDYGFGIETDLRDICGKIVISHNCPEGNEVSFEDILNDLDSRKLMLALNIKADGQSEEIIRLLNKFKVSDYFTFDMSIPEMVVQSKQDIYYFTGVSDICREGVLYENSSGVWLDSFDNLWYDRFELCGIIKKVITQDHKKLCIVSEDLHHRDVMKQWECIKSVNYVGNESLFLCTDKPLEAKEFFNV